MKRKLSKIALGITIYYPNKDYLDNILSYAKLFENIFIYLNSPIKKELVNHEIFLNRKIVKMGNNENIGLSKSYNLLIDRCFSERLKYLLILDQDSVLSKNCDYLGLYHLEDNMPPLDAALISLDKFPKNYIKKGTKEFINYGENIIFSKINFTINSGSVIIVDKFKKFGGYDEELFVDKVDKDICRSIKLNRLFIYKISHGFIYHDVGDTTKIKILNLKLNYHKPSRIYSIAYSRIIYNKKWILMNSNFNWIIKLFLFFCITNLQIFKHIFFILLSMNKVKTSIISLFKGTYAALISLKLIND